MGWHQLLIEAYVGRVDDMRYTPNGKAVFSFSLPTDLYAPAGAERESLWWRCTLWEKQAESLSEKIAKGTHLMVVGEVAKPQLYQDKTTGEWKVSLQATIRTVRFLDRAGTVVGEAAVEGKAEQVHDEDIPF